MFFLPDILKKIFYFLIVCIVCTGSYIYYDVALSYDVNNYLTSLMDNSETLSFIYNSIKDMTWYDWGKVGIIIFSPIIVTVIVIMNVTHVSREKKAFVDYHKGIKNRWR